VKGEHHKETAVYETRASAGFNSIVVWHNILFEKKKNLSLVVYSSDEK
jgi:hypothetical protein